MKLPRVRHRKGKYLGKNLWECSDARATSESKFEGSSGGGGYVYYGYKNPQVKLQKTNRYIRNKVDEAYIDRLLKGVCRVQSPDHKENG